MEGARFPCVRGAVLSQDTKKDGFGRGGRGKRVDTMVVPESLIFFTSEDSN